MDENLQSQQPVAPQQPSEMQPMPKEKLPMFSMLTVALILVVIAGYLALASFYDLWPFSYTEPEIEASPTPATTRTYINEDYGFKLKYPRGGEVSYLDHGTLIYRSPELFEDMKINSEQYVGDTPADVFISIQENEIGGISRIVDNVGTQFGDREEKFESIYIGDIPATKVTVWSALNPEWIWETVFVGVGDNMVMLMRINNGPNVSRDVFEDLYKSFEFDMSKWKTYSNSTYNYSVIYPPEWTVAQYSAENVEIKVRPYAMPVIIKVFNLEEFSDAYGEATVAAEEITLDSGYGAFRFEQELEIGATVVITYMRLIGQEYLVLRHGPFTSQSEQVIQSLQIN